MAVSCKERLKTALPGCGMVSAGGVVSHTFHPAVQRQEKKAKPGEGHRSITEVSLGLLAGAQ